VIVFDLLTTKHLTQCSEFVIFVAFSHSVYSGTSILGCDAKWCCRWLPLFRTGTLLPFSGSEWGG